MEQDAITIDELSATFSKAAADGYLAAMRTLEAEKAAAGSAAADPLVEDAIEKRVDELFTAKLSEAQADWQLARDREAAEKTMVQPGAAKHAVSEVLPRIKSLVGIKISDGDHEPTPVAAMSELERETAKLHDNLMVIRCRARDKDAACRRYLHTQGLDSVGIEKALDTYTSTFGVEWVNSVFSTEFVDRIALGGKILPLFYRFPMAAKAVTVTGQTGRMTAYRTTATENTAVTADTTGLTTNVAFSAEEISIYQAYSDALDADAVVATLPKMSEMMVSSVAEWLDIMIMDGCDSADMDTDWSATSDPRYAWDGLRKKAKTQTGANADLSTFTLDTLLAIPGAMAGFADDPEKLSWIVPQKTFWTKLFTLTDNGTNKNSVWLPCNGPSGLNPVVTGQIGWLGGIPVTTSSLVKVDANAAGVYDGTTSTKAVLYCVHRDSWWFGDRQMVTIDSQHMVKSRNTDVVMTIRCDFQHMRPAAKLTTALGYNF